MAAKRNIKMKHQNVTMRYSTIHEDEDSMFNVSGVVSVVGWNRKRGDDKLDRQKVGNRLS